jgi:DNA-binding beta-propeller fold protein YncE
MMVERNVKAVLIIALLALLLGGCATRRAPAVLDLGVGLDEAARKQTWPSGSSAQSGEGGEKPRYRYAGQLTGEENFLRTEEKNEGLRRVFRWLVEFFIGEEKPVILQRPQSGVVDGTGRILVTDTSRQAVYVFDPHEGRLSVWESAIGATRFISPAGIAPGMAGETYVADAELGFVVRLDRNGKDIGTIGKGEFKRPVGLAFDAASRQLYVADTRAHVIKVFDIEGRLLRTMGKRGEQPGEFNFPTYIALAKGELYVADTMNARVQVLDAATGAIKLVIGKRGVNVGNLVRPKGVSVDSEGNVYVVESYYDHLLVYNKQGEFLMPIGGTGQNVGNFYLPSGVWVDAQNRVFVADMFNGRISIFQFLGGDSGNEKDKSHFRNEKKQ